MSIITVLSTPRPVHLFRILLERDPDGWHAIVIDCTGDVVVWITDSYASMVAALRDGCDWVCRQQRREVAS